jgi:hypothetical protein
MHPTPYDVLTLASICLPPIALVFAVVVAATRGD